MPSDVPIAVTITRAAQLLDCSRGHVYQLIERGQLRRVRIAGSTAVRIPTSDLYGVLGMAAPSDAHLGGERRDHRSR